MRKSRGFFSPSLVITVCFFLLLFVVSLSLMAYASSVLPGNLFYPVKIASESIKVKFSQHPNDTAVLYQLFLAERAREIKKIALDPSPIFEKKSEQAVETTIYTANHIMAGLILGEIEFDQNSLSSSLSNVSTLPEDLKILSENISNEKVLTKIEVLSDKLTLLSSMLGDIEKDFARNYSSGRELIDKI